jgi:hypothetical protein
LPTRFNAASSCCANRRADEGRAPRLGLTRHYGRVLGELYAVVACILSFAMCVLVVYFLISGRNDRDEEEAAREYFTAHGHWPDEA